ncbi:MAG TPA: DUF4159 domain-containing protein [Steroidobacter sp.]|nr:DUF4159 domain-containing protein [Steroidobacter sp.]
MRASASTLLRCAAAITMCGAMLHASGSSQQQRPLRPAEFHFVRLIYSDNGLSFGGREHWLTDWPDAERHLLGGVRRLTRIDAAEQGHYVSIMDDSLFDYPWLYAVEVGRWILSDEEAARLRDYLLRGGFLVVDDFHGTREWAVFAQGMYKIFPDRAIVDIPPDDPVFHVAYELNEHVQIPGIQSVYSGQNYERDGFTAHWRGVYDDDGRLMVVINFNMDLGDAWEHADFPEYSLLYTTRAYKYAINYILYAMTH